MEQSPFEPSSIDQRKPLPWGSLLLAVIASVGFGYLAFGGLEATAILEAISRLSALTVVGAVSLFLIAVTLRVTRWWLLMKPFQPKLPFTACAKPFLLSIVVNDFMLVRIGDLVKMFANRENIQVPPSTRLGTIIIERIFDTISILIIFFLGVLYLDVSSLPSIQGTAFVVLIIAIGALLILLFFSKFAERCTHWVLNLKPFRKVKLLQNAKEWTTQFFQTFTQLRNKGLLGLFALSCLIWGLEGTMALTLAWGIDPSVGLVGPDLSLACGALSNFLPSAPGQIGTLDYFLKLGVLGYGMDEGSATAFALLVHLIFLSFSAVVAGTLIRSKAMWKALFNLQGSQNKPV